MEHVEGFDAAQEDRLRSRKKAKGIAEPSEAERWRDVYKILFPHDDVPSPCKVSQSLIPLPVSGWGYR